MGAYNAMQQSDVHSYWEFNYQGTNWVHPLYELPFTGGFPDKFGEAADTFEDGEIGKLLSIVPGPGPAGKENSPVAVGDNPNLPRDPDKFDAEAGFDNQREFRERGVPAAWPTRFSWTFTSGSLRSCQRRRSWRLGCTRLMQTRLHA
jgi:hypothetical protein